MLQDIYLINICPRLSVLYNKAQKYKILCSSHTWDRHFSFAGESVVHWPHIWWSPGDVLHDLSFLHPLQLRHVGHDTSAARLQALRCLQSLVPLRAGSQQLAGSIAHPDFMINLFLNVTVLQQTRNGGDSKLKKKSLKWWETTVFENYDSLRDIHTKYILNLNNLTQKSATMLRRYVHVKPFHEYLAKNPRQTGGAAQVWERMTMLSNCTSADHMGTQQ